MAWLISQRCSSKIYWRILMDENVHFFLKFKYYELEAVFEKCQLDVKSCSLYERTDHLKKCTHFTLKVLMTFFFYFATSI